MKASALRSHGKLAGTKTAEASRHSQEKPSFGIGHNSKSGSSGARKVKSMYAIAFDLDTSVLEGTYHVPSWGNAYTDIRNVLQEFGFTRQQGSVYFGNDEVDAVKCVLAVMAVAQKYDWFEPSVRDIRMLRIEDNNDLMPAVRRASANK